jgi:hypothetical protein
MQDRACLGDNLGDAPRNGRYELRGRRLSPPRGPPPRPPPHAGAKLILLPPAWGISGGRKPKTGCLRSKLSS